MKSLGRNQDRSRSGEAADEQLFSDIYDHYWERLFRYVIRILPDEDDVADVLQETFVTFWELRNQLERVKSVKSYLFTIARNLAFKRFRERAKEADFADRLVRHYGEADESTAESLYGKELNEWFDREVERLPERMREVVVLSRKEQLSYKEIAERLNISDQTVKKQISKSLKLLRLKLDEEYIPYLMLLLFIDYFC
ncbi:RNA polymerase sigma factor [Parapedobacter indicus]|uniref:RNA polymerase sigma-70 factor, ECF subfamily n=1 Tax=Parapedobacter indicus TaxID=1477437 RepID=A0A1I3EUK3_9SPHI|nr:RNA polymerase sigma-70 factor [Parapedobacter indicus]PPL03403.1 RNA polymerase sigma-70 factor (ECF subfamily) [Parapedobacter indicus]SFI02251.1 RNA polymerase sigma-70 factor, ECF subfamily [Parapedobacter indicus]